jgi:hypothetical protein
MYGLLDRNGFALAATSSYRFGAYSKKNSPYLQGMGNRKDTVLGGLALQAKLPAVCLQLRSALTDLPTIRVMP